MIKNFKFDTSSCCEYLLNTQMFCNLYTYPTCVFAPFMKISKYLAINYSTFSLFFFNWINSYDHIKCEVNNIDINLDWNKKKCKFRSD